MDASLLLDGLCLKHIVIIKLDSLTSACMHSAVSSSTGIFNSIAILAIFLAQKFCFLDILKKNADSKKQRGNYMYFWNYSLLCLREWIWWHWTNWNFYTVINTLILHFILHITTWRSGSYREAHFLISLMKCLFVAEKEKRGLLKTRSAYAYCHNFTKKCNAKHIIWLMCFWKWKWYQTLVGFDYSFFNDVHRLKFNLSYHNMLFTIFFRARDDFQRISFLYNICRLAWIHRQSASWAVPKVS